MAQEKPAGKSQTMTEKADLIRQAMLEHKHKMGTDPKYRAEAEQDMKRWGQILGYDKKN